jgi:hypothetical protein
MINEIRRPGGPDLADAAGIGVQPRPRLSINSGPADSGRTAKLIERMTELSAELTQAHEEELGKHCGPALRARVLLRANALQCDLERLLRQLASSDAS